jgi:hypothetical protein
MIGLPPTAFSRMRPLAATGTALARLTGLVALLLLQGCAMVQVGYSHLDTLAAWKADEYFDLDPQQKHELRARFDRLHEWHRREQLPDYVAFLRETKSRLSREPTRQDIAWITEGVRSRYRVIVERAAPDAAVLLATLRPEQIEAAQKQWQEDNRKWSRERRLNGGPEARRQARADRALEEVRKWTRGLTAEQARAIVALSDRMPPMSELRLKDRIRRQGEFRQLLEGRAKGDFEARLTRFMLDWESGRAPEYQRVHAEWWEQRQEYFIALYRLLTPEQRAQVLQRLQDYIDDFAKLAARRSPAAE